MRTSISILIIPRRDLAQIISTHDGDGAVRFGGERASVLGCGLFEELLPLVDGQDITGDRLVKDSISFSIIYN